MTNTMTTIHINGIPLELNLGKRGYVLRLSSNLKKVEDLLAQQTNNKQMEELTMTNTTTNTTTEATTIIENIKQGKSTMEKVKAFDIKGMIKSAWKAVKEFDYVGAANKAWDKLAGAVETVDTWLDTTKTGKATAYTIKATSWLFVAGLLTHGAVGAVLLGAGFLAIADYFFTLDDNRPALKGLLVNYAKNVALMTGMATAAWLLFPLVVKGIMLLCNALLLAVILPLMSVFL